MKKIKNISHCWREATGSDGEQLAVMQPFLFSSHNSAASGAMPPPPASQALPFTRSDPRTGNSSQASNYQTISIKTSTSNIFKYQISNPSHPRPFVSLPFRILFTEGLTAMSVLKASWPFPERFKYRYLQSAVIQLPSPRAQLLLKKGRLSFQ